MRKRLTAGALRQLASQWRVEEAVLRAVVDVESSFHGGFLPDERPVVLFEAHVFARETGHRYNRSYPKLSSARWNRQLYCRGPWPARGYCEQDRLAAAARLHRAAALRSASYGLFQVMGFNWQICGFKSLQDFINAMWQHEDMHLRAFAGYCEYKRLLSFLRERDFAGFAYRYNGSGWEANDYAGRMKRAYDRFKQA